MAVAASEGRIDPSAWRGARAFALLLTYVAAVALAQMLVSPTVEQDQAEQLVLAQRLAWNYTNQPPLYTWLVWALTQLTGHAVVALWAIKICLLCLLVAACDGTARELGLSAAQRRVAAAGLALLPAVIWEAQRDLTHSLLAAVTLACVMWSLLRGLHRPAWWRDVLTGLLAGAAMLSKHNALVLLLALPAALCLVPEMRCRLRWRSVAVIVVVASLACMPHGLWLWLHPDALDRTFLKLHRPSLQAEGVWWDMGRAMFAFLLPWGLLAAPMAWRVRRATMAGRFLSCLAACVLACLMLFVVALDVERFTARWLFPMLFFWPMWLAAAADPVREGWGRLMVVTGLLMALVVAVAMPARVLWPLEATRQNLPYATLAGELARQWDEVPRVMLASNHLDGGNLKGRFGAGTHVLTPIVPWRAALPPEVVLVAREKDLTDVRVRQWFHRVTGLHLSEVVWQGEAQAALLHLPHADPLILKWARVRPQPLP